MYLQPGPRASEVGLVGQAGIGNNNFIVYQTWFIRSQSHSLLSLISDGSRNVSQSATIKEKTGS